MKNKSTQSNRIKSFYKRLGGYVFKRRALCLLLVLHIFSFHAFAQTVVTGTVKDSKGETFQG
jgi:hypothetical protein